MIFPSVLSPTSQLQLNFHPVEFSLFSLVLFLNAVKLLGIRQPHSQFLHVPVYGVLAPVAVSINSYSEALYCNIVGCRVDPAVSSKNPK
jgi:hypothetical protein